MLVFIGVNALYRQSSNRESGYLLVKIGREKTWEKQSVIFEEGSLRFAPNPLCSEAEFKNVPMENVQLLRSNVRNIVICKRIMR